MPVSIDSTMTQAQPSLLIWPVPITLKRRKPMVITGWRVLNAAGIPTKLGVACLFSLAAGLIMIIGARAAKRRLDSTWYWTRPDLIT